MVDSSDSAAASGDDSEDGSSFEGEASPEPQLVQKKKAKKAKTTKKQKKKTAAVMTTKKKPKAAPAKNQSKSKSKALQALGQIMRAAGIGPAIYKGLPTEDDDERAEELSVALKERGVKFKGLVPTPREISKAKAKYDLAKSLDGIDTSNIIDSSDGDGGGGGGGDDGSDGEEGGGVVRGGGGLGDCDECSKQDHRPQRIGKRRLCHECEHLERSGLLFAMYGSQVVPTVTNARLN